MNQPSSPRPNPSDNNSFWKGFSLALIALLLLGGGGWLIVKLIDGGTSSTSPTTTTTPTIPVIDTVAPPPPPPPPIIQQPVSEWEARAVFDRYIKAWNERDVNTQISLLHPSFKSVEKGNSVSYFDYIQLKRRVAKTHPWISVECSNVNFEQLGNNYVVTYYQHFQQPSYESYGTNKFYFQKINGKVTIYKEQFDKEF